MGNAYAYRGRLAPALILVALVALVIVALGMAAAPAKASSDFTLCSSCHNYSMGDAFHSKLGHVTGTSCATCHVAGPGATGLRPSACASCHGKDNILAKPVHPATTCGVSGCHAAPSPTPTPTATAVATTVTAKVAPKTIKLRKRVKTTGAVTPVATLAGKKVALRVDLKKGKKWVKAKTAKATVTATGTYSWKYKPLKRGTFRVKASIARSATYKASKSAYKTFKVK